VHKEWLIDMSGDVDEEGWEYAPDFHCSCWHGCYKPLRSFVRRRRWIRLRRRKGRG
ncbi:3918_t:CDS:2, partial [Dentiscutata heterogama]